MKKVFVMLAVVLLAAAQIVIAEAAATPTPKPSQIISFTDLHNAVDAGLVQWKNCKPGPAGNKTVSVADYERYVEHTNVPLPKNQLIDYAQALKYAVRGHDCKG